MPISFCLESGYEMYFFKVFTENNVLTIFREITKFGTNWKKYIVTFSEKLIAWVSKRSWREWLRNSSIGEFITPPLHCLLPKTKNINKWTLYYQTHCKFQNRNLWDFILDKKYTLAPTIPWTPPPPLSLPPLLPQCFLSFVKVWQRGKCEKLSIVYYRGQSWYRKF